MAAGIPVKSYLGLLFPKIYNLNKRCRLKPEKGAGIW
jgi:hypothetical protein